MVRYASRFKWFDKKTVQTRYGDKFGPPTILVPKIQFIADPVIYELKFFQEIYQKYWNRFKSKIESQRKLISFCDIMKEFKKGVV